MSYNEAYYIENKKTISEKATEKWHKTKDFRTDEEKARRSAYMKEYRIKNREKLSLQEKEYRKLNKDKYSKFSKEWKKKNKDKISSAGKKYYEENSKDIKAYQKEYNIENKEKVAKRKKEYYKSEKGSMVKINSENKRRHIKKMKSDGTLSLRYVYPLTKELQNLLDKQDNKCNNCRCKISRELKNIHLDHHIPLSKGGSHSIDNVAWLCAECNMKKHDTLPTLPLIIRQPIMEKSYYLVELTKKIKTAIEAGCILEKMELIAELELFANNLKHEKDNK